MRCLIGVPGIDDTDDVPLELLARLLAAAVSEGNKNKFSKKSFHLPHIKYQAIHLPSSCR